MSNYEENEQPKTMTKAAKKSYYTMKNDKIMLGTHFYVFEPLKCLKLYDKHVVLNFDLLNFILNCLLNFRIVVILFPLLGGGPANIQVETLLESN